MEKTLAVLNQLEAAGHVVRYAIGGATGLMFYTEPMLTYDLDVFCLLRSGPGLVSLAPIYDFLRARGFAPDAEHVLIEGIPVQFLPAHDALLREAVEEATEHHVRGVATRVFTYEHLVAVMVETGREKDRLRLVQALDECPVDDTRLQGILTRHNLSARWHTWRGLS